MGSSGQGGHRKKGFKLSPVVALYHTSIYLIPVAVHHEMHATPERWTGALKKKKKKADHRAFFKLSVRAFGFEDSWARESI